MAKPDLDDGWLPYAHELDAALAVADFGKGARIVLREVFSQCFGLAKHRTATLSPTEIAGRVGLPKEQVVRAISSLVESKALVRVGRGEYRFVKDYEKWLFPSGERRLSAIEIAWCMSAPYVALAHAKPANTVLNTGAPSAPNGSGLGAPIDPVLNNLRGAKRSQLGAPTVPNLAAPYRNGRGIEERDRVGGRASQPDTRAPGNGNDCGELSTIAGLVALAEAEFNPKIAGVVRANAGDIVQKLGDRLDCYLAALRQASRSKTRIRDLHAFCMSEARKYVRLGIPPEPVALDPTPPGAVQKSKLQDEAFERALADIPEDL